VSRGFSGVLAANCDYDECGEHSSRNQHRPNPSVPIRSTVVQNLDHNEVVVHSQLDFGHFRPQNRRKLAFGEIFKSPA
jgi:hypothetical protein